VLHALFGCNLGPGSRDIPYPDYLAFFMHAPVIARSQSESIVQAVTGSLLRGSLNVSNRPIR
jgi:hypothetical protein